MSRSPNLNISGFPGPQISKFPKSQIFRFPDFQTPPTAAVADKLSDANLTPLPTHPGTKYVARALAATMLNAQNGAGDAILKQWTSLVLWQTEPSLFAK